MLFNDFIILLSRCGNWKSDRGIRPLSGILFLSRYFYLGFLPFQSYFFFHLVWKRSSLNTITQKIPIVHNSQEEMLLESIFTITYLDKDFPNLLFMIFLFKLNLNSLFPPEFSDFLFNESSLFFNTDLEELGPASMNSSPSLSWLSDSTAFMRKAAFSFFLCSFIFLWVGFRSIVA